MTRPPKHDPVLQHLKSNPEIGLLAIDFSRRIRMRINGKGVWDGEQKLTVTAEQVYGNCPKYIQKRSLQPNGGYCRSELTVDHSPVLHAKHQTWISNADTFFIGSVSSGGKMDASHRGGPPGFVKVVDDRTLLFPDYFGNSMYNTLGNIYSNPGTGLLFIILTEATPCSLPGGLRSSGTGRRLHGFRERNGSSALKWKTCCTLKIKRQYFGS